MFESVQLKSKFLLCLALLFFLGFFVFLLENDQWSRDLPKCPMFEDCTCPEGYQAALAQIIQQGSGYDIRIGYVGCVSYDSQKLEVVFLSGTLPSGQCNFPSYIPCSAPPVMLEGQEYGLIYLNTGDSFQCALISNSASKRSLKQLIEDHEFTSGNEKTVKLGNLIEEEKVYMLDGTPTDPYCKA